MQESVVKEIVNTLVEAKVIHPADNEKAVKALEGFVEYEVQGWKAEDIKTHIEETLEQYISDEHIHQVLVRLDEEFDANDGINYDVINCTIDALVEEGLIQILDEAPISD